MKAYFLAHDLTIRPVQVDAICKETHTVVINGDRLPRLTEKGAYFATTKGVANALKAIPQNL
ncbi:hypothetical protein FEK30_00095 (plasmid) [Picosynechococcus sp. PCC 11901]|uniref:hypothetical protein n=1 Tax=unclassified Picosynechococcus TaxID=3079910 RepID=UPI0010FBFBFF|nr:MULTISPECIES: hypothetical protein [unclassified Picosynechococcus]QCS47972.1 hypothetical protein FEK30_00095 [Picosynechococcus sp. PCC 11901]